MAADRTTLPAALAGARDGAEWAWNQLHNEFAPRLGGYLSACAVDDIEGEVGEIFVVAARSIGEFDGDIDDFGVELFRIAVDRVASASPRAPVKRRRRPAADGPTPAFAVAAMQALDAPVRDTILLRRIGGLSVDEVARVLDTTAELVYAYEEEGVTALKGSVF